MTPHDVLETLLSSTQRSLAALLVDEGGETVDWVSNAVGEDELRLAGAYVGLRMRRTDTALGANGAEPLRRIRLERHDLVVSAERLQNDWCIVLVQSRPAYPALVRGPLQTASTACDRLLWPEAKSD